MKKLIISATALGVLAFAGYSLSVEGKSEEKLPELFIPGMGQSVANDFKLSLESMDSSELPEKQQVYKFKKFNITLEDARKKAAQFDPSFEKAAPKQNAQLNSYSFENETVLVEIEKDTGKMYYQDKTYPSEVAKNIPSDEEAVASAEEFLEKFGWLPETFEPAGVTANTIVPGDVNSETEAGDYVSTKTVHFYQKIDQLPVLGVSRIMVEVGDNGQIVSARKYHKEVGAFTSYGLKSVREAAQDLQTSKGVHNISEDAKNVVLDKVELAYYEDPASLDQQTYLQPVYVFEGTYYYEGKKVSFSGVVPAVSSGSIKAMDADVPPAVSYKEKEGK